MDCFVYLQYTLPCFWNKILRRKLIEEVAFLLLIKIGFASFSSWKNWFFTYFDLNFINLVFYYSVALFAPNSCFFFLTLLDCFVVVLSSPVGTIYYAPNFLLDTDRTTSFWSSFCQRCTLHDSSVSPTKKIDYYTLNKDWTIFPLWCENGIWVIGTWNPKQKVEMGVGIGHKISREIEQTENLCWEIRFIPFWSLSGHSKYDSCDSILKEWYLTDSW